MFSHTSFQNFVKSIENIHYTYDACINYIARKQYELLHHYFIFKTKLHKFSKFSRYAEHLIESQNEMKNDFIKKAANIPSCKQYFIDKAVMTGLQIL